MKQNIGKLILIFVLAIITALISYIIVSKQHLEKETFNIKVGDVLEFNTYDTKVKVLNIASTLCNNKDCFDPGEVELSLRVDYNGEISNYVLKTTSNPSQRIKNSNNYIVISLDNKDIKISIKDKTEIEL